MFPYAAEDFTAEEQDVLRRYVTNLDRPVFALVNLPEVVKGALFARYSRSPKSLRRLFLDEFVGELDISGDATVDATVGMRRAVELYERVFNEYGDDSVAQLGGVHLACEQASNVLTKVLEWGRLMAYLEQSTRYIAYNQRLEHRPLPLLPRPGGPRLALRGALRGGDGPDVRHIRRAARGAPGVPHAAPPASGGRLRPRPPAGGEGEGARRPPRAAAGGLALERRDLRYRTVLRAPAAAHAFPSTPRGASLRGDDARGVAQGDPLVPPARRSARPRRCMVRVPRRHP